MGKNLTAYYIVVKNIKLPRIFGVITRQKRKTFPHTKLDFVCGFSKKRPRLSFDQNNPPNKIDKYIGKVKKPHSSNKFGQNK